jgi:hypothetical protein
MIKLIALAAVTLLAAAPANAQGVRVSLAGKSVEQIQSDIGSAARTVCWRETQLETFRLDANARCIKATTKAALEKTGDLQAAANASSKLAQR